MLVETKFLGEVNVEESKIFTFENGVPGFAHLTQFTIIPVEKDSPFMLLQSLENKEIGFILAYPFAFKENYAFELSDQDIEDLQVENEEAILTYAIVTLKDSLMSSTMNLLAPVVLNTDKKLGKQIVLQDNSGELLRYPLSDLEGSVK